MGIGAIGRARAGVAAIKTLADIRRQARAVATDAERVTLSGWPGWGPLSPAFAPKDETWADIAEQIHAALPAEHVEIGMRGTYNAFYTPRRIAEAMWTILGEFGFDGGPVAELGCGGGMFFGTAPEGVSLFGVERDPTAAAICGLLHPRAKVVQGALQETPVPSHFAAVIGNVPYGDVTIHDPAAPKEALSNLHNYFIWRAVRALAPGGYAVLLTSRFTMDSRGPMFRHLISEEADFVGALRLPNGALADGGTDISADIVVLRRHGGAEGRTYGREWKDTSHEEFGYANPINSWWVEQPDAVFGRMVKGKTTQYGLGLLCEPDGPLDDLPKRLVKFVRKTLAPEAIGRNLRWSAPPEPEGIDLDGVVSAEGWHEGSMRLTANGGVVVVVDGKAQPLPKPGRELLRLLRLRDLAVALVEAEADYSRPDAAIAPLRADTLAAYEDYVKHHGALNRYTQNVGPVDDETGLPTYRRRYPTMQGFRHDPDSALVFALEVFQDDADDDADEGQTWKAEPAPILFQRQNVPRVRLTRTDDPEQALAWCLDRRAEVDLDYIAGLLGWSGDGAAERVAGALGDRVFCDPASRKWLTAEEYLSGDVRKRHRVAVQAAESDSQFTRNVEALRKALPKWLGPAEIRANLGATWIGPDDITTFIAEEMRFTARVRRVASSNQWEVEAGRALDGYMTAKTQWGTSEYGPVDLIEKALNGKTPVVYKTIGSGEDTRQVKDAERSMVAAEKQQQIKERFAAWVWEDPDRARRLETLYNERFNALVARTYSGEHITVEGMASWFKPYLHQREFVARAMATPAALCGHPVGAGKTYTMAMTAMKLKQVGLVNKPMIVVPNHLIEQIDREIRQLFPAAKILVGSSTALGSKGSRRAGDGPRRRRSFTARCATQDWDLVLVTHTAFNSMEVDASTQAAYVEAQEQELTESLLEATGGRMVSRMVKGIAKQLDRMRERISELRHSKRQRDAGVRFEQLGVDYLLVDEFHYYKNLAVPVRTDGFSVRPSKRATDLDMKLRYLSGRGKGRYAALFSGTPVSNTMLELYVCMHYTMRPYLRSVGIGSADSWAATFVEFVNSVEVTVDGGDFQMRTRPALFVNAPELRVMLSQAADIRSAEQLGLKRPKAELRVISVEPTKAQARYSQHLVYRAEQVRSQGWSPQPGADNMLAICGDGRRMATDPELVGIRDDGYHKLHVAAENIVQVWRANPGKLQVGFLDIGTPRPRKGSIQSDTDYQTYGRLRRILTDHGMDVRRIRFIHDAKDDAAKAQLFRDCRRGKVDVILGSTDKLGVGTNIQKLIVAMHHIDAPYRPADVEQRDGRGLRPGNVNKLVTIFRYVTKRTFDAYMWQMLTRKITFISQMMSGNLDRTIEDVTGDDVLSFAAIKAAATDQPLLQEKAEVQATVKRLRLMESTWRQSVNRMRVDAPRMRKSAERAGEQAASWAAIAEAGAPLMVDGQAELPEDLLAAFVADKERFRVHPRPVQIGGLTLGWRSWTSKGEQAEMHPLLTIDGGAGWQEARAYKAWKEVRVAQEITSLILKASYEARYYHGEQERLLKQAEQAEAASTVTFEQADELTSALARLDQIEAALRDAAVGQSGPGAGDVVIDATDPVEEPADADVQTVTTTVLDFGSRVTVEEVDEPVSAVTVTPVAVPEPVVVPEPVAVSAPEFDMAALADFAGMVMSIPAAQPAAEPVPAAAVSEPPAEAAIDLAVADFAGMVMRDLEAEVAAAAAELFAGVDFSIYA
ncbi:DEAD/DEAH box helicase family protein [Micromonospora tulbaghiae]|uniref:DEAD/DEAH box helicase family protein n=1 Tax=Micromonospora tulbaghiae TaxID=479978 RepID=UPI0033243697